MKKQLQQQREKLTRGDLTGAEQYDLKCFAPPELVAEVTMSRGRLPKKKKDYTN